MSTFKALPILKASGEITEYKEHKLEASLLRSGATAAQTEFILKQVGQNLYPGISTRKIYQQAFKLLRRFSKPMAAKYKLKAAIMELGPSGFPFEKYIAAMLRQQGYSTQTGIIMQGKCVSHEVDVIARKDDIYIMIECKYHNHRGTVSDVKIPLYIHSRFLDIEAALTQIPANKHINHEGWVITNTRFSDDAVQYGNCAGLKLLGWDYPKKNSLNQQIEKLGLYPITCLTSLTKQEKLLLLQNNIVLCREICENPDILLRAGLSEQRLKTILEESSQLCQRSKKNKVFYV